MKRLLLKFDILVYRLFYWRWSPRLKNDPDLAYMFAEIGAEWSKARPPRNPETINQLLEMERERIRKQQPCLDKSHWH